MKPILNKEEIKKFLSEQLDLAILNQRISINNNYSGLDIITGQLKTLTDLSDFIQDYQ